MRGLKHFLVECDRQKVVPKAILRRLQERRLNLIDMRFSKGMVAALSQFVESLMANDALDSFTISKNNLAP